MNSQRLLAISSSLADELQTANLLTLMTALSDELTGAINGPSESTQRAVQSTRDTIETALRNASSNSMSPGMRADLDAFTINGRTPVSELIGTGLLTCINKAFDSGGYVSVASLDQIKQLVEDVRALNTALQQLNNASQALALHQDDLEPGDSVVGFTIPRDAVENELDHLQKEITFFGRLVSMVNEVVTGSSGVAVKVRSLQSSDFGIELATSISVAASLATVVDYIVRGLKKLKKVRAVKDGMQQLGFEQEFLDKTDKMSEEVIDAEIERVSAKIFQNCKVDDQGRVNELKTGIHLNLKGLAARLERGYSVEVRTELPSKATEDDMQKGAVISGFSQIRFERTTPLLKLTDGDEEPAPRRSPPAKKTRQKRASTPSE